MKNLNFEKQKWKISRSAFFRFCIFMFVVMVNYGCSVRTSAPPVEHGYPVDKEVSESAVLQPYSHGSGSGLYGEAKDRFAQGRNDQAAMTLERALRVEPGNPAYWYYMGKIKYRQSQYGQAIQFCLKSKSLAGKNDTLRELNDRLINQARARSTE